MVTQLVSLAARSFSQVRLLCMAWYPHAYCRWVFPGCYCFLLQSKNMHASSDPEWDWVCAENRWMNACIINTYIVLYLATGPETGSWSHKDWHGVVSPAPPDKQVEHFSWFMWLFPYCCIFSCAFLDILHLVSINLGLKESYNTLSDNMAAS